MTEGPGGGDAASDSDGKSEKRSGTDDDYIYELKSRQLTIRRGTYA